MGPVAVVYEDAHKSLAFNNTTNVYLAKIPNPNLLKKWIREEVFLGFIKLFLIL